MKKGLSLILAVLMVFSVFGGNVPYVYAAESGQSPSESAEPDYKVISGDLSDTGLTDSGELFAGYVDKVFSSYRSTDGDNKKGPDRGISLGSDANNALYNALASRIVKVASGEITSTYFELSSSEIGLDTSVSYTASDLGVSVLVENNIITAEAAQAMMRIAGLDIPLVINALMRNYPYELYWFDKTAGYSYSGLITGNSRAIRFSDTISFGFTVSEEYADISDSTKHTVSPVGQVVADAAENAAEIVEANSHLTDYEKLAAYKDAVCALTDYNFSAAGGGAAYGNPWQLIWVFDEDESTKVVCEGYSKAFQYLCQLTEFNNKNIESRIVNGTMSGGTGAGRHMWNVVTMGNGNNYIVDVTNCDDGTAGYPDQLFLAGAEANSSTQYTVNCKSSSIVYSYSDDTVGLYAENLLRICNTDYENSGDDPSGDQIAIDETNFPDEIFRSYVSEHYDSDNNGYLDQSAIEYTTYIYVGSSGIGSLQGIEFFTSLEELQCSYNQLTTLDVSKNTALKILNCGYNQLTALDVSRNTALTDLECGGNQLATLDVSNNSSLTRLHCSDNQLTALDVSSNTELTKLYCEYNQLTALDLSNNTALTELICRYNQLTALDISSNTALINLYCGINQIGAIDVSKNTDLVYLDCELNQLTSLDVSNNLALAWLNCNVNQLSVLDVSNNSSLSLLACDSNQLTQLDVSSNTALRYLQCTGNQLTTLDISRNTVLESLCCFANYISVLDISNNNKLIAAYKNGDVDDTETSIKYQYGSFILWTDAGTEIVAPSGESGESFIAIDETNFPDANFRSYVSEGFDTDQDGFLSDTEIAAVHSIEVYNKDISSLQGVEVFTELSYLDCSYNNLSVLDVGDNKALISLYCGANQLTALDLRNNTNLENLNCAYNQLTVLDLSNNTKLDYLDCNDNQITALDVSGCSVLKSLHCAENNLTELVIGNNAALEILVCAYNQLTNLDIIGNTALESLDCVVNQLSALDVSNNTELRVLCCWGNSITVLDLNNNNDLIAAFLYGERTYAGYYETEYYEYSYYPHGEDGVFLSADTNTDIIAPAKDPISIDEAHFPDAKFRSYVSENFDTDQDGCLDDTELLSVNRINVENCGISSLQGIEFFTALSELLCGFNPLTELDVRNNKALILLDCRDAQLTELDVSTNTELLYLYCYDNQLTELYVGSNTGLITLCCGNNLLTTLDINNNTALNDLDCYMNQLTSLDLSNNKALRRLDCRFNQLTTLDIHNNPLLGTLYCGNSSPVLDISNNYRLVAAYLNGERSEEDSNISYTFDQYCLLVTADTVIITPSIGDSIIAGTDCETEQTVSAGETVDLSVFWINGANEAYFQWEILKKGEWVPIEGATDYKYEFTASGPDQYRCVVSNEAGNSDEVVFTMLMWIENDFDAYCPEEASIYYADPNTSAVLEVIVSGNDLSRTTFQWREVVDEDGRQEDIEGATGQTFTTPILDYVKTYVCVVEDGYGYHDEIWIYVLINNALSINAVGDVYFSILPNESVEFAVAANATDMTDLTYQWYYVESVFDEETGCYNETWRLLDDKTGAVCQLESVNEAGQYVCRVTDKYGNTDDQFFEVHIENHFRAYAEGTNSLEKYITVEPGADVELTVGVAADNTDGITYHWYEFYYSELIAGETTNTFRISNISRSGRYYCVVQDTFGNRETVFFNISIENGFVARPEQKSVILDPSKPVTLNVIASCNNGSVSYEWYALSPVMYRDEDGNEYWRESWYPLDDVPGNVPSFTIDSTASVFNTGEQNVFYVRFICYVSDMYENRYQVEFDVYVDKSVTDGITAGTNNPVITADAGGYVNMSVDYWETFGHEVSFQWYDAEGNAIEGETSSCYNIPEVYESAAYYCVVTNEFNRTAVVEFTVKINGEPVPDGWQKTDDIWYYYKEGVIQTGWQKISGKWYYFNTSGAMQTGWQKISGKWYFFSTGGAMQTGWQKISGKWYYFNTSGAMQTGWQQISGKWYYFNTSGAMQTGWLTIGEKTYYCNTSGVMLTGWQVIEEETYYFNASGVMFTGWLTIDDKTFYLDKSGVMLTGLQTIDDNTYYFADDGGMEVGWQKINDTWYYFRDNGAMATGWVQINGKWYYFSTSGAMVTGWQTIDGKTYFFKSSGAMAANEWCQGWWLNANGTWTYKYKASWKQNSTGWWYEDTSGWYAKNCTITIDSKSYTFDSRGYWVQ